MLATITNRPVRLNLFNLISSSSLYFYFVKSTAIKGIGYGGKELSASARTLIGLVNELQIPTKASDVVLIDVHSGLGPTGTIKTNVLMNQFTSQLIIINIDNNS